MNYNLFLLFNEIYQMLFFLAITYILQKIYSFSMHAYAIIKLKDEKSIFTLTTNEKIILWVSIAIFFSFLL